QGNCMRIKFEAVDKNGKLHKRASVSRFYSHCVVIHFAGHPPSKFWPKGVTAYSRAEWGEALRWPNGVLAAGARSGMSRPSRSSRRGKCDAVPEGQEPRAGKLLQLRLTSTVAGDSRAARPGAPSRTARGGAVLPGA